MTTARNAQSQMTEAQIDRATAGHRMAGMEPNATDAEIGRRQLRGEITGDKAVELAVAVALAEYEAAQPE
ncbi:hypothetical protein [Rhodococcus erythropolis]|uniref:hypothetical protein n=1 Tax=Rhodococcus erythropolis TaxID=1833 RepID=UPI00366E1557